MDRRPVQPPAGLKPRRAPAGNRPAPRMNPIPLDSALAASALPGELPAGLSPPQKQEAGLPPSAPGQQGPPHRLQACRASSGKRRPRGAGRGFRPRGVLRGEHRDLPQSEAFDAARSHDRGQGRSSGGEGLELTLRHRRPRRAGGPQRRQCGGEGDGNGKKGWAAAVGVGSLARVSGQGLGGLGLGCLRVGLEPGLKGSTKQSLSFYLICSLKNSGVQSPFSRILFAL